MPISLKQLKGLNISIPKEPKIRIIIPKPIGKEILFIEKVLKTSGYDFEKEYRFDTKRKFRFDWCVTSLKLGVEYEGIFSEKSRHTTKIGYTGDSRKYNYATIKGWKVLRYTALSYKDFENDLKDIEK